MLLHQFVEKSLQDPKRVPRLILFLSANVLGFFTASAISFIAEKQLTKVQGVLSMMLLSSLFTGFWVFSKNHRRTAMAEPYSSLGN